MKSTQMRLLPMVLMTISALASFMVTGTPKKTKAPAKRLSSKGTLMPTTNAIALKQEIATENDITEETSAPSPETVATAEEQPTQTVTPEQSSTNLIEKYGEVTIKPEEPDIIFNFENADLQNLITYIESIFDVTFIPDDVVNPILQTGKAIGGNKISFKTQKPLTKTQAWSLFTTFLDMAGLSLYQEGVENVYRITTINNVKKSPIPAFIGVNAEQLPDNDTKVRYIYFIENTTLDALRGIIDSLRSSSSSITFLQELKAFMLTDSAYNIKVLMRIIKELDKVTMPQAMSVLKLRRVDATRVKSLYDSLLQQAEQPAGPGGKIIGPRKPSTAQYFPEDVRLIAEARTNSLVLLGAYDAISKVEDFITKHIDVELSAPYSPLHVHPLKYADAETVASIMGNVAKFGQNTPAAQSGGVRGQDKYLKPMTFTAEPTSNRIIVRGEYEDFLKAKEVMEQLDEPQAQVAIEVLILSVSIDDAKELGAQIRSKTPGGPNGLLGNNVKFQTSGLRAGGNAQGVITNASPATGSQRLLGDLINLVVGKGPGNTVLSLGTDQFGVWGIFQALKTISNVQVVSNPFLIATNKTPALISLGETRRVVSANVISGGTTQPTFTNADANLTVNITPQINSDGMIILNLSISIDTFSSADPSSGAKTTKKIDTSTIVADKEILALGGLIRNKISDNLTKTPVLGDIPIFGWLFKNKRKTENKENLLVLISTKIIEPFAKKDVDAFTKNHIKDYYDDIKDMRNIINDRDVIDRTFFKDKAGSTSDVMDKQIFKDMGAEIFAEDTKKNKKRRGKKNKDLASAKNSDASTPAKPSNPVREHA